MSARNSLPRALVLGCLLSAAAAESRAQAERMFSPEMPAWGDDLVLVADLDRNGRPDLITDRTTDIDGISKWCVEVRMGRADGSLGSPRLYPAAATGGSGSYLQIADVTSDGVLDAVFFINDILVLPGMGDGSLGAPIVTVIDGQWTYGGMAIGDVDGDAVPDVALARAYSDCDCVMLHHGVGDGSFVPLSTVDMGHSLRQPILRDFDGDGLTDVFALVQPPNPTVPWKIAVSLSQGGGAFSPSVITTLPSLLRSPAVEVSDLDADGRLDVVAGAWWKQPKGAALLVMDNVDGSSFAVAETTLLPGGVPFGLGTPVRVALHDLDADGSTDVLLSIARLLSPDDGVLHVFPGLGGFDFAPSTLYDVSGMPLSILAADVDLDGRVDVVHADYLGVSIFGGAAFVGSFLTGILHGTGDGMLETAEQLEVGAPATDVGAADLDGDGHQDLVVSLAGTQPSLVARLGHGDGTFTAQPGFGDGSLVSRILIADITDDSVPDLVAALADRPGIELFVGTGSGAFAAATQVSDVPAVDLELADMNGDGSDDLLSCDPESGVVQVHFGSSTGSFSAPLAFDSGGRPSGIDVGDFDGDGLLDVIVANAPSGPGAQGSNLAFLKGSGPTLAAPLVTSASGAQDVVAADLDGDGVLDAAVSQYVGSSSIQLHRGFGNGSFATPGTYLSTATVAGRLELGDLNRDGLADLVACAPPADQFSPEYDYLATDGGVGVVLGQAGTSWFAASVHVAAPRRGCDR